MQASPIAQPFVDNIAHVLLCYAAAVASLCPAPPGWWEEGCRLRHRDRGGAGMTLACRRKLFHSTVLSSLWLWFRLPQRRYVDALMITARWLSLRCYTPAWLEGGGLQALAIGAMGGCT